jgi:two-component system NtrC family sensor kinase
MNEPDLERQLEQAQQTIRVLQEELDQTSHGLVALSSELEQRVEERTAEFLDANRKLKETQMYLIQTEKMASLGQLVAGIAHEINNPLAFVLSNLHSVAGWLEKLAEEQGERLSEPERALLAKAGDRLRTARTGLDRVKELVLNLRTFSRLDEGEFKSVDIPESIEAVLMFLEHRMKDRIRVEKHYSPERTLYCYAGRVNQVFMNVLANAVEAIEGEGTITIRTEVEDGMFCISIRDTGAGIPEGIQGRIFDPFFTTKPVGQGTGLGLAISYGIVQAHQGSIEAASELGQGSEFRIRIPTYLKGGKTL